MPERPVISLCEYPYPMLILLWPSGGEIAVQCGGDACTERSVEGRFLPLPIRQRENNKQENDLTTLAQHLEALHPAGCRDRPITEEEADRIDSAFVVCAVPILVNRARLQESTEAWLPVRIREAAVVYVSDELSDVAGMEAILTWQNCD